MAKSNSIKPIGKANEQKRDENLSEYVFGRVQPQALPLEEAVLGAIMLDKNALSTAMDILQPISFYSQANSIVYKAMLDLFEKSQPIDLLTVADMLIKTGELDSVGGHFYLSELTNKVVSSANIEYYARVISQKYIQRELIRSSTNTIKLAYDDTVDIFDLLEEAENGLFSISENHMNKGALPISTLAQQAMKRFEELSKKGDGVSGIPTGFANLDNLTGGFQRSDLIIIAGRPAMGKTSLVLSIARNAAMDYGQSIAVFSLEMSNLQLAQRLISMESEIKAEKLRNPKLEDYEWQQLQTAVEKISEAKLFIDDTPGINIFELRAKCRRMKMQHGIDLIIIDYLQLMTGGPDSKNRGNREQEISAISRALKEMAKDLDVPVIALAQLSRAVETRGGDKRPMLSDLRESGAIEQDADIVSFVYRPEYYGITEDEEGNSLKGVAELIVAKHRNGATENVKMQFIAEYAKFANYDENFNKLIGTPNPENPYNNVITRPSRMNEDNDDDFATPF